MILNALYDLCERDGLIQEEGFEKKKVHYALRVDVEGNLLGITPLGDDGKPMLIPRLPKRASGVRAGLLVDNSKYVLGIGMDAKTRDDEKKAARTAERNLKCREAFVSRLEELTAAKDDPALVAVKRFYANIDENLTRVTASRPESEWTGGEFLAFEVAKPVDGWVHEQPAVKRALNAAGAPDEEGERRLCLVTGKLSPVARLHPSIKRVPSAQSSGASLVSFNSPAFESQGDKQGDNAWVSPAAAVAYGTALNHLLEGTEKRPFRYGVKLSGDTVVVFWTKAKHDDLDTVLDLFDGSTPEDALHAAESPLRGIAPHALDATEFYALTLAGNAARVVVRDWITSTMGAVKSNLARYFADLSIAGAEHTALPLWSLLKALEDRGGNGVSPAIGTRLFRCALEGTRATWPHEILAAAVKRFRIPPVKGASDPLLVQRAALVKASLLRIQLPPSFPKEDITVALNEDAKSPAYHLGRLFAVLERLQGAALGDVNATMRDRYFGAASTTPAATFPRLLRLSMHHGAKLAQNNKGLAQWYEAQKASIMDRLEAEGFEPLLSLEHQGLFALGYYHQREAFFRKKPDATSDTATTAPATADA